MDRIPGNSLDSSNGGLVQTLDTESRDFVKACAPVLEVSGCGAECLPTTLAQVATTPSPPRSEEAMGNDLRIRLFQRQSSVCCDS